MISITIDVLTFILSAYYNEKMDSLDFLKNVEHRYIWWSIIDQKIPDILRSIVIRQGRILVSGPEPHMNMIYLIFYSRFAYWAISNKCCDCQINS